jgi:hypothetical protein
MKRPLPEPSACGHCGINKRDHFQQWTTAAGWHKWAQPTAAQMAARYRALRATPIAWRTK